MTPKLRFSKIHTRESALAKAAIWYDNIADDKVATFATAIGGQADVSCESHDDGDRAGLAYGG